MAYKVQKPCKTCGKMFTPCGDCESDKETFRWRRFACSYECGKKYLEKVLEARGELKKKKEVVNITTSSNFKEVKNNTSLKGNVKNKKESEQID